MMLKANITDMCGMLDSKANVDDINKVLTDLHSELDTKAGQEEVA